MSSDFLPLLDHFAHDVEDFGVIERNALSCARLALEDIGIDQPQRRHAARVTGLHGFLERSVDLVAQHSYGLFQKCAPGGAGAHPMHICRPIM